MSNETIELQEEVARLKNEIAVHRQAMEELKRRSDIQDALNEILNISLMPVSLEQQVDDVLSLVLNIPWLALEEKGCIFLADDNRNELDMVFHRHLSDSLLKTCRKVPFGACLCGKAALEQKLVFRPCVDADHAYRPEGIEPHGHYTLPVVVRGKTLSVLNLYVEQGHRPDQLELDFLNACGKALAGIIERKLIEKKLLRLSSLDELTGLANRRKFMEQLTESLKLAERFGRSLAVLFLDLDFFKAVNDAHGHEYGDLILVNAARRIKTSVRETDLVARLGGDEFIVMLEMITSAQEAEDIARNIIRAVSAPYQINGTLLTIGVSIGVSLFPQHDRTSEGLLKKADLALYGAKENRGKAIVFEGIVS